MHLYKNLHPPDKGPDNRHHYINTIIIIIIIAILIAVITNLSDKSRWENFNPDQISDPIQINTNSINPMTITQKGQTYTITPIAKYKISAIAAGIKTYNDNNPISPMDIALIWGDLATPNYEDHLTISQSNRWYHFRYTADSPHSKRYIEKHSANTHIIPENDEIQKTLKKIRKDDIVYLEGYLVNIKRDSDNYRWSSSKSRKDTGDGSCEVMYVKGVEII